MLTDVIVGRKKDGEIGRKCKFLYLQYTNYKGYDCETCQFTVFLRGWYNEMYDMITKRKVV